MPSGSSSAYQPLTLSLTEKDQKVSFLHGEETNPRKTMYISLQTHKKTIPQLLTENKVENFICFQ